MENFCGKPWHGRSMSTSFGTLWNKCVYGLKIEKKNVIFMKMGKDIESIDNDAHDFLT